MRKLGAARRQLRACQEKKLCTVDWIHDYRCRIVFHPNVSPAAIATFCDHIRDNYSANRILSMRCAKPGIFIQPPNAHHTPHTFWKLESKFEVCTCVLIDFSNRKDPDSYMLSNFEKDISTDPQILTRIQNIDFAKLFYGSLCNTIWIKENDRFAASFRYAAGLVAELRGKKENYLDFYISSPEGVVSSEVQLHLNRLGWYHQPYPDL